MDNNPFSNLDDQKLMKYYCNGENMAFDIIYLRYHKNVYSYLSKRVFDDDIKDDLFQKIFMKFHKSRLLYNSKFPLLKWIYTICRSELLDFIKLKKITFTELKEDDYFYANEKISSSFSIEEEHELTSKEQEAIKLRYYSEEDYMEISKILNTTEPNARKIVSRGIKKLRQKYLGDKNG